ncbi:hypothetical protein GAYE_SCF23G4258 [Galdieria yellowstonensis]|uniref:Agmatine deiminase n=1 Tax=Galdieria yellowstonensis TaxID=3028027 RepID=A0AAV9IG07_9RHOD|nr:hypothetical protein GAYE_SCF23G4258 [Galdieria yellowstonensis]
MSLKGFRYPAEWEEHSQCWIGWPERPDNWRQDAIPAQEAFVKLIETLSKYERVTVAASVRSWKQCRDILPSCVRIVEIETNDCWLRDTGPIYLTREVPRRDDTNICGLDFYFNAWGGASEGCYPDWEFDSLVAWKILEMERIPRIEAPLVLEGGAVVTDGEGTIITTEECLLNKNRNPDYMASIRSPGVILLHWTEDREDPQYKRSAAALEILESSTDARGRKFIVRKILGPAPQYRTEEETKQLQFTNFRMSWLRNTGQRLPASYVNAYIGNGVVVCPSYNDPNDKLALGIFEELFHGRAVKSIPVREILLGGGGIHCVVNEQPMVTFPDE